MVECLQFRWQVSKLCRLWNDAIIGENHNTFPAVCVELLLRLFQFFSRRRQCKRDSLVSVKVGMQTKGNPEEIVGLFRKPSGTGRHCDQFAVLHHITVPGECAVFSGAKGFADFAKIQHFEHIVGETVQFLYEAVFRIEATQLCVTGRINHMTAICACAGCQIPQILQRYDAAVGAYFLLHLN